MMTLLNPVFLSLIPDNDCILSSNVAVMPDDDLTESSVSVCHGSYIMTVLLSGMALMPNDDLAELGISVCCGFYTRC